MTKAPKFNNLFLGVVAICVAMFAAVADGRAASAARIDADIDRTLTHFYDQVGGARELVSSAAGVLVFPSVVKAGMGVGGEYGEGALRTQGRTRAYFNTVSASIGFQLGVQARSVIILFMTPDALERFRRTKGWKVGVDGSVTVVTIGAGGSLDSNQIKNPVLGFIFDAKGLMYNLTLEGTKISPIKR